MRNAEPIRRTSPDITTEQVSKLRELFPEVFTEGKIDFEKLRLMLGGLVEERRERYSFMWAGKRNALENEVTDDQRAEEHGRDAVEGIERCRTSLRGGNVRRCCRCPRPILACHASPFFYHRAPGGHPNTDAWGVRRR